MREQNRYLLGESESEHARLRDQAPVLDPLTRRLLTDAGITAGMRVLDIGTGAGAVAALAADLVGDDGHVLAIDRDRTALDGARRLLSHRRQIEFAEADLASLDLERDFDAIVGRIVLMHLSDPVDALDRLKGHLRPGGLLVMHEFDLTHEWTSVSTPLWRWVRELTLGALEGTGTHLRMGPDLFASFRAAGLPDPHLSLSAPAGGGAEAPSIEWTNAFGALLPYLEQQGVTTAEEVDMDSLVERLDAELDAANGTLLGPLLYGAHCAVG